MNDSTDWGRLARFLAALLLILAVAVPYLIWRFTGNAPPVDFVLKLNTIDVAKGQQENLELDDGTRVVLDSGSLFQYPDEFLGESREVFLSGEGYFEVTADDRRPFLIHANGARIRVLGTRFNVRAWQNSKKVEVVVSRGRVSLSPDQEAAADAVVITEGQGSTLWEGQVPTLPETVDVEKYLGWLDRETHFQDAPLFEILILLERWYDIQFVLSDGSITAERLTVYIDNRPLDEILELIATLTNQEVEREGNLVILGPNRIN
ncbi:MAG: FecR family protein [Candidatus Aminicenantaceae bacterium]